jgi:hypothetical protein
MGGGAGPAAWRKRTQRRRPAPVGPRSLRRLPLRRQAGQDARAADEGLRAIRSSRPRVRMAPGRTTNRGGDRWRRRRLRRRQLTKPSVPSVAHDAARGGVYDLIASTRPQTSSGSTPAERGEATRSRRSSPATRSRRLTRSSSGCVRRGIRQRRLRRVSLEDARLQLRGIDKPASPRRRGPWRAP